MYLPSQTCCHYHRPPPPRKLVVPLFEKCPQPNALPIFFWLFAEGGNAKKIDYIHVPALPADQKARTLLVRDCLQPFLGRWAL